MMIKQRLLKNGNYLFELGMRELEGIKDSLLDFLTKNGMFH
jgi:hypothetical protein